ncbi:hypothetical protein ANCCEY_06710 [Ancylostoma ceylanicum]|uniref:Carboxylesterase type B domain-containing protein n=2 Tax=Ancylostoma ceylanicum TaxID=53326 RepID=A0A0D6LVU5_9BILA|nr:hypothetical protein ANCCEY_06710 [Ancylostoma ceylanicum]EYB88027.1 hypothetical protein Y032_0253g260 [Ancylostoma ceylanicum]
MRVAPLMQKMSVDPEDYPNWNRDRLINEIHKAVKKLYIGDHLEELVNDIISYYVDRDEEQHFEFYIDRYTEFLSDLLFVVPSADGILARSAAGWDMYAYSLDHYNEAIWDKDVPKRLKGAPHGCEFQYTKAMHFCKHFHMNEEEQVVADVFRHSFIEFVRIGDPSNEHEVWLEVGAGKDLRYLQITPKPLMKLGFYNESTSFWHEMRKYDFDMVQTLPTVKSTKGTKQEL